MQAKVYDKEEYNNKRKYQELEQRFWDKVRDYYPINNANANANYIIGLQTDGNLRKICRK